MEKNYYSKDTVNLKHLKLSPMECFDRINKVDLDEHF